MYLMGLQPIQRNENLRPAGGADPLVRAGPPGPATSSIDIYQQQADVGVGRGPGGPPHFAFVHPRPSVLDLVNTARMGACATSIPHLTNFTSTDRYVSLVCSRLANSMPGSCADAVPAATAQRTQSGKSFFLVAAHTNAAASASPAPMGERASMRGGSASNK